MMGVSHQFVVEIDCLYGLAASVSSPSHCSFCFVRLKIPGLMGSLTSPATRLIKSEVMIKLFPVESFKQLVFLNLSTIGKNGK